MPKKILFFSFLLIFILPLVIAQTQQSLPQEVKQYQCVSLPQTCSNCSAVNITSVKYPNQSQALGEVRMTKIGTEYNYTFCNTSALGSYIVNWKADPDGTFTCSTCTGNYDFKVTPTGDNRGVGFFLILTFAGIVMLGAGLLTKNPYFGFISGAAFLVLGVYTMIYGFLNLADIYTRSIAFTSLGLGLFLTIVSSYEFVEGEEDD